MDLHQLKELKNRGESFYIYFSAPNCNVCRVLEPKIKAMFANEFPKLLAYHVDTSEFPEIAAQEGLYTNPSILVYLDGQEVFRKSRNIGLEELREKLSRYYNMLFQ